MCARSQYKPGAKAAMARVEKPVGLTVFLRARLVPIGFGERFQVGNVRGVQFEVELRERRNVANGAVHLFPGGRARVAR